MPFHNSLTLGGWRGTRGEGRSKPLAEGSSAAVVAFVPRSFLPLTTRSGPPPGVLASGDLARRCRREYLRAMKKDSGCDSAQREPSSPHRIRLFCSATKAAAVVPTDRPPNPPTPPPFPTPPRPPPPTP